MRLRTRIAEIKLRFISFCFIIALVRNAYEKEALYRLNGIDWITYQPPARKLRRVEAKRRAIHIKYGAMMAREIAKYDPIALYQSIKKDLKRLERL